MGYLTPLAWWLGSSAAEARTPTARAPAPRPSTGPTPRAGEYIPPPAPGTQTSQPSTWWSPFWNPAPPSTPSQPPVPDDLTLIVNEADPDFYEYAATGIPIELNPFSSPSAHYVSQKDLGEVRESLPATQLIQDLPDNTQLTFPGEVYEGARDKFYQNYPLADWQESTPLRWFFLLHELDIYLMGRMENLSFDLQTSNLGEYQREYEEDGKVIGVPEEPWGVEDLLIVYARVDKIIPGLQEQAERVLRKADQEQRDGIMHRDANDMTRGWEEAGRHLWEMQQMASLQYELARREEEGIDASDVEVQLAVLRVKSDAARAASVNGGIPSPQASSRGSDDSPVRKKSPAAAALADMLADPKEAREIFELAALALLTGDWDGDAQVDEGLLQLAEAVDRNRFSTSSDLATTTIAFVIRSENSDANRALGLFNTHHGYLVFLPNTDFPQNVEPSQFVSVSGNYLGVLYCIASGREYEMEGLNRQQLSSLFQHLGEGFGSVFSIDGFGGSEGSFLAGDSQIITTSLFRAMYAVNKKVREDVFVGPGRGNHNGGYNMVPGFESYPTPLIITYDPGESSISLAPLTAEEEGDVLESGLKEFFGETDSADVAGD